MNDERIQQILNKIKGRLLIITAILAVAAMIIRYVLGDHIPIHYALEGFILLITAIVFILRVTTYSDTFDERIEKSYETFLGIMFLVMLYGGFAIHFYIGSLESAGLSAGPHFINILLLIGLIVFAVQLKKHQVYANYKWIESSKKIYILKKIKNFSIFAVFFLLNIIFYFMNQGDLLIGFIVIVLSIISLGFIYFFFALYEKNKYDQESLLEQGLRLGLTKNAALFLFIPVMFRILNATINFLHTRVIFLSDDIFAGYQIQFLMQVLALYGLDISILILFSYLSVSSYIKQFIPSLKKLLPYLYVFIIIFCINAVYSYALNFVYRLLPLIISSPDTMLATIELLVNISNYLFYASSILLLFIAIYLLIKKIDKAYLLLIYVIIPLVSFFTFRYAHALESVPLALLTNLLNVTSICILFGFFVYHDHKIIDLKPKLYDEFDMYD